VPSAVNERDYHDRHYAYEAGALFDSAIFGRVHERAVRDFLQSTGAGRSHRILSLGCGDGAMERRLAPHVGQIVGVDISAVAIEKARARCSAAGLGNVSFVVAEPRCEFLERLGRFDFVAAFAFLHHLDDDAIRDTLLAARKVIHPRGAFYSADPSLRRFIGLFKGLVRRAYDRHHSPDERELDPEALSRLALQAGFSRPVIDYIDYFLGPLAWLAPGAPRALAVTLEGMDNLALRVPLMRRYASSFRLLAHPCCCSTS
jgi:SAM-dependent methyltransferase